VNGILTRGLDQRDLVEALNRFADMPEDQLNAIRHNNHLLFKERFSIEICAKKYECLFLANL
jgi:glycosyltransferase involved in cell wall biosynthesis